MQPTIVDFTRPTSAQEVALAVGACDSLFAQLTNPVEKLNNYKLHRIPKRRPTANTTHREVWECVSDEVATIHKTFARRLTDFLPTRCGFPSQISHGYVPGRSTRTNAEKHAGSTLVLRIDIANFFHTITKTRVHALLTSVGMKDAAASALTELCTIEQRLPLGLHGSPIIANFACLSLDQKLSELAQSIGATVTRYADDITFSGHIVPPTQAVFDILNQEGFQARVSKCRETKRGQAHYVTGLSVSDVIPRLPRMMKRRIRQELYYARRYGLLQHIGRKGDATIQSGVNRIDGTLRYFNAVEPILAAKLQNQWQTILINEKREPAYSPLSKGLRTPVSLLVDETDIPTPDGQVLAISMTLVVELEQVTEKLRQVTQDHLADPFSTGDKEILESTGLHHVDISEDLRTSVFKALEFLPIRGYIAYDIMKNAQDYRAVYERLVSSLLPHRFMFCDGAEVSLVFEENSKLSLQSLNDVVDREFETLQRADNRRPKSRPSVRFGTKKGDPCIAVADFLLAAFRQYAVVETSIGPGKKKPGELAIKRFERLRDRIRLIQALTTNQNFSRRHPFRPWPDGRPTCIL